MPLPLLLYLTLQYHLTLECITAFCTDEEFNAIPMDSAVRQLQWQDGLDYIYVATDTSVSKIFPPFPDISDDPPIQVTQVPLEECSTYTDCDSCINHRNPLCGWCTVEEKCSRRSQCQNATGTMRWEQNITECITIIDVSPNQFVLNDQDDNVSLLTCQTFYFILNILPSHTGDSDSLFSWTPPSVGWREVLLPLQKEGWWWD